MPWRDPTTAVEGTLFGRITDASTSAPIDNATVQAGSQTVTTDGNGYYTITLLPAAEAGTSYNLTAGKTDYPSALVNDVLVKAGLVTRQDIQLGIVVPGDIDRDGDVDATDLDLFATCLAGSDIAVTAGCESRDLDGDNDVDQSDFARLQLCYSGASIAADASCAVIP
jgi:hypothetical protein